MKKVVLIIGIIPILLGIIFFATAGISDTATAFFEEVEAKNYTKAYSYLSEDFQANTSQRELIRFLDKSALLNFEKASWNSRSISGNQGTLGGSVITKTKGSIPIKIKFVKENNEWKIYAINKPQAGLIKENSSRDLPQKDELMKLTDESMIMFAKSVNNKDFTDFHSYISNLWKKQWSVEKFNEAFKPFMDKNINFIPALKATNPEFDVKPTTDKNGLLILEGHYPTRPSKIIFKLSYIYEGVGWKLIGTKINIR